MIEDDDEQEEEEEERPVERTGDTSSSSGSSSDEGESDLVCEYGSRTSDPEEDEEGGSSDRWFYRGFHYLASSLFENDLLGRIVAATLLT